MGPLTDGAPEAADVFEDRRMASVGDGPDAVPFVQRAALDTRATSLVGVELGESDVLAGVGPGIRGAGRLLAALETGQALEHVVVEVWPRLLPIVDHVDAGRDLAANDLFYRPKRRLIEPRVGRLAALLTAQEMDQARRTANAARVRREDTVPAGLHPASAPWVIACLYHTTG